MMKDSIRNSKSLPGGVEARTKFLRGWLSVSMYAMASLMTVLVAITAHRRLMANDRADGEGAASAGDPDSELPASPQQFFRPTLRTADGKEPLEFLDIDLPLCQERLFQRRPLEEESHRCVPMNQSDSSRRAEALLCTHSGGQCRQETFPSAEVPASSDGGLFILL